MCVEETYRSRIKEGIDQMKGGPIARGIFRKTVGRTSKSDLEANDFALCMSHSVNSTMWSKLCWYILCFDPCSESHPLRYFMLECFCFCFNNYKHIQISVGLNLKQQFFKLVGSLFCKFSVGMAWMRLPFFFFFFVYTFFENMFLSLCFIVSIS